MRKLTWAALAAVIAAFAFVMSASSYQPMPNSATVSIPFPHVQSQAARYPMPHQTVQAAVWELQVFVMVGNLEVDSYAYTPKTFSTEAACDAFLDSALPVANGDATTSDPDVMRFVNAIQKLLMDLRAEEPKARLELSCEKQE